MVNGTTLFKLDGNPYYSPAFARGGESATFSVEVTHVSGSPSFVMTVQHRNEDETTWTDLVSIPAITTTGVYSEDATGIKQLVRLKLVPGGTSATSAVHYFASAPAWRP